MKKRIFTIVLALITIFCCMVSAVSANSGTVLQGTAAVPISADTWEVTTVWTGTDTPVADGNGIKLNYTNSAKQPQAYFVSKSLYRFYSGCGYTANATFNISGISGSCGMNIQTGSDRVNTYVEGIPSFFDAETHYFEDGKTKKNLDYQKVGYISNGALQKTGYFGTLNFYKDSECNESAVYADGFVWIYMLGSSGQTGSLGISDVKIIESSPMSVSISGSGTVKVNDYAVKDGGSVDIDTGSSFTVTLNPSEGKTADTVVYEGKTYKVYNNAVKIENAQRFSELTVNFTDKTEPEPIYRSNFNAVSGIPSEWNFVSENYWNTNNKKIRIKELNGLFYPTLSFYNINPGADAAQHSKFYALNNDGITVHAGAKYEIAYKYYTENMTTWNGLGIEFESAGFDAEIFKNGVSKCRKTAQNITYSEFGTDSASGSGCGNASYAVKFNKINGSESGFAAMRFGVYGEGNSRGDNINYEGIAFGFADFTIREFSPLNAKITGSGSVTVNNTVLKNGDSIDNMETGTPLEFVFNPETGYEIESVKYGGNAYEVKDNKLTVLHSLVCSDVEVVYKKNVISPQIVSGTLTAAKAVIKTIVLPGGTEDVYNGSVATAYAKINDYNKEGDFKYAFDVTDPVSNNTLRLECGDAKPGLAVAVRIIGGAVTEGTEYTFKPVIYE